MNLRDKRRNIPSEILRMREKVQRKEGKGVHASREMARDYSKRELNRSKNVPCAFRTLPLKVRDFVASG